MPRDEEELIRLAAHMAGESELVMTPKALARVRAVWRQIGETLDRMEQTRPRPV